jgi:23S rRNA (uracil1939-C5)-methyltransferase
MKKLRIERLGARGEGIAIAGDKRIFVPYALAGEEVAVEIENDHGQLIEIVKPAPQRIAPICRHYGTCGGCAVQSLETEVYRAWKRDLVVTALHNAGLETVPIGALVDAHGAGRRRATFHARFEEGKARIGFMAARSHRLIEIDSCPLFAPELDSAAAAARNIAQILAPRGKPLDVAVTATPAGLDIDLRGAGPLEESESVALIDVAHRCDLARLSNHGRLVALRRRPWIGIGDVRAPLPPGAFLQATAAGEAALATRVIAAASGAKKVADLFCGVGAFALRLASFADVEAYDEDAAAIDALNEAARSAAGLRPILARRRDLFARPLAGGETERFGAVVFDPPRAGAKAQAEALAHSGVPLIIAISCNAQSFSRDAAILISGGYSMSEITPIDQFLYAPHVEIFAIFRRPQVKKSARRRLLG